jgi:hypothetical protein
MTREEFDKTRFTAAMTVDYRGGIYWISTVNFYERLLGIIPLDGEDDDLIFVRCESVELLP